MYGKNNAIDMFFAKLNNWVLFVSAIIGYNYNIKLHFNIDCIIMWIMLTPFKKKKFCPLLET